MRQLLLMRHAKSAWDDPKLPDHGRPLNARGRRSAVAMRDVLKRDGVLPELILVSSARRTLQTLQSLEPWDRQPIIEPMDALYLAPPGDMLDVIHTIAETMNTVLLIGHNPGLHELAMILAGAQALSNPGPDLRRLADGFPTGALADFAIDCPWSMLGEGAGRLLRFDVPRDLPEMAV